MQSLVSRLASLAAGSVAVCALTVGGVSAVSSQAHAQASVLLKHQSAQAVVETVDHTARELLLREGNGHLITIEYGSAVRDLPHVSPGDKLSISFVETLGADLAQPGSPLPESTLTTARGYVHGHPRGVIASFRRERAKIETIDLPSHTVSFVTEDDTSHIAVLRTKAMQDFLATLKVGDVIDITRMESISYIIQNDTVAQPVAPDATAPAAAAQAPVTAPAPAAPAAAPATAQ
ncbi:hypothetical protein [Acetobacter orientalis]|uniref:hypothetical protein n=1 Tax=Acetobacter orientalis TaxID=146474 RepID=UPI0039ED5C66